MVEKFLYLLGRLLEKSRKGEIPWQESAEDGAYQAAFPNYAVRILSRERRIAEGITHDYVLQIYSGEGKLLDEVDDEQLTEQAPRSFQGMKELHSLARGKALGVHKALDEILSALGDDNKEQAR
jgi:hypothetical protein